LFSALALLPVLPGCGRQEVRTPPPGFAIGAAIESGDADLDARVVRSRQLADLDSRALAKLREQLTADPTAEALLEDVVLAQLGRGNVNAALAVLQGWVNSSGHDERAMATYLDLAIGADRIEDCVRATDEYMDLRPEDPWVHLARGICLERYHRPDAAHRAYVTCLQGLGALEGHTATLERELGLSRDHLSVPDNVLLKERARLLEAVARRSVIGHAVLRHVAVVDASIVPHDPRLLDLGGVSVDEMDRIFLSRRDAFRHCQLVAATRRSVPGGRLVLHVTIDRNGAPTTTERERNSFEVEQVPSCIEDQVLNLWFPQPRYGAGLVVEREFRMVGD
jgi:hypothetical protein